LRAKYAYLSTPAENGREEILMEKLLEKRFDLLKYFGFLSSSRFSGIKYYITTPFCDGRRFQWGPCRVFFVSKNITL